MLGCISYIVGQQQQQRIFQAAQYKNRQEATTTTTDKKSRDEENRIDSVSVSTAKEDSHLLLFDLLIVEFGGTART